MGWVNPSRAPRLSIIWVTHKDSNMDVDRKSTMEVFAKIAMAISRYLFLQKNYIVDTWVGSK